MSPAFDHLAALPDTRKVERPKLGSLPLPDGWSWGGQGWIRHEDVQALLIEPVSPLEAAVEARVYREAMAAIAGIKWVRHERAVRQARRAGGAS